MAGFQRVHIQRFKNVSDTTFDLGQLNVIVGANNSGKSSILQAIHFAIGSMQSLLLNGDLAGEGVASSTVNPSQFIYVPSEDPDSLGAGGRLWADDARAVNIELTLETGEIVLVSVKKGKNRNIVIGVSDKQIARSIGTLESPFTIFTPGLAGIAKQEHYLSDGVLLRTIARGDANLVLRNTLLRLWVNREEFLQDLHTIFPDLELELSFDQATDEYIHVTVNDGGGRVPLELAGTGILQTIQILSYIHYYRPQVIVLDEPDSHLHPNNQRLLCSLLRRVAQERNIQVILSTHSRHVIDALRHSASFLWARSGNIGPNEDGSTLSALLELGALDVFERIGVGLRACYVLTEDEKADSLWAILGASGFTREETEVLPYYGCTTLQNLRPLVEVIRRAKADVRIIVHRDRDYFTDAEVQEWENEARALRVEPFLTDGVDIESYLLSPEHLSELNGVATDRIRGLLDQATNETADDSIAKYINSRIDIERKAGRHATINHGELARDLRQAYMQDPNRFRHSKTVLKKIRELYRQATQQNLRAEMPTNHLAIERLRVIARGLQRES
ncbi:MAG TPA: AAA family ATPase [Anaerolineales bacterium]|nr:AAA family ATPase [Anaerolineales bacterium]HRQ92736.1 AAA family ATPase [Anaerolineales bacterium]